MARENRSERIEALQRKWLTVFVRMYPYIAILGVSLSVALTITIGSYELARSGLETVGIPVIIASIVLIVGRKFSQYPISTGVTPLRDSVVARLASRKRVTVSVFLVLFAVSVWLLTVSAYRPWTYFLTVSLIYALIIFQIFVPKFDQRIILVEVPLVMLNLIYSVTLKYTYYYGFTDIFGHVELAKITYWTGHTVPENVSIMYADFPLYHIFVSEATYFLNLDMKTSLFVVTAIVYVVTTILLYYLVRGAFQDDRVPLLVIVLYSANSIVLFYGSYMITRTMAYVGFIFIFYLIYKQSIEDSTSYIFLLVLMTFFTTIVHQVSMPQIILLLSVLYVCKRLSRSQRFLRLQTLLLITGIFLLYWVFYAWDFVMTLFDIYTRPEHYDKLEVRSLDSQSVDLAPSVQLARRIRYLVQNNLIVFFSVLGIGTGLYSRHTKYAHTLLLFSLLTLGLFVPSPIRLIGQAMDLFRFDRFELLVSPFIMTAMGVGVVFLLRQVNQSRSDAMRWVGTALTFVLVITYISASVTHPLVASDSKELPWSEQRKHLTETELEGFNFVLQEVPHKSRVRADADSTRFFRFYDRLYQKKYLTEAIFNVSNVSKYEGYTVFRNEKFQESGLNIWGESTIYPDEKTEQLLHTQFRAKNKIFSNGDVEIYYTNESSS